MDVREVIRAVNQMQHDGIILAYAIGGAVGAAFYLDPVATLDVDVFVGFSAEPGSLLISPKPLLDYLLARGAKLEGEYVVVGGWPVQFLPPTGPLVEEALDQAAIIDADGVPARVFTAEHLAAIALQTGRAKDKARLALFVESGVLDSPAFEAMVKRHGLLPQWQRFQRQYLHDAP